MSGALTLSSSMQQFLASHPAFDAEWQAISHSKSVESKSEDLLNFARRLQVSGNLEGALEIYGDLVKSPDTPEAIKTRVRQEVEALEGKGGLGGRVEVLLKQVLEEAVSPKTILPMMGASMVGSLTKVASLGRIASAPASVLTLGQTAKLFAGAAGYIAEGLAFAGLGRAVNEKPQGTWGEEIARSYVGLGALKFSGWVGKSAASWAGGANSRWQRFQEFAVPQLTMFAGLSLAHKTEEKLNLRPQTQGDHWIADTLAAMISLQLGTKLGHAALGAGYRGFQQELELASEWGGDKVGSYAWATPEGLALGGPLMMASKVRVPGALPSEGRKTSGTEVKPKSKPPRPEFSHPSLLLQNFTKHYDRIYRQFEQVLGKISDDQAERYLSQLGEVEQRRAHWIAQTEVLDATEGEERLRFAEDIGIGLGLLREKLLRVGAEIYQEPLENEKRPRWGLRFRPKAEPKEKPEKTDRPDTSEGPERPLPKPPSDVLPALLNHDVGYGKALSLRDHQIEALYHLRGRLRLLQSFIASGIEAPPEALAGTLVMPVGGGKTRTMVAGFAAAIELAWMNPKAGDKLIILNHTDQIHRQNLKVAGLLSDYSKKQAGRPLKISEYKAEQRDVSGDVIVVSIPSIGEATKRMAFQEALKQALGQEGKVAMVAVDEVHHLGLGQGKNRETWAQAIQSIRDLSPQMFQIGFTATPTGREAGRLFTVRERELMQAGVTPRTYLVNVDGIDLSQLKVTSAGEFEGKSLQSTLLGHPDRNARIYAAINERGMRAEKSSPSGKAKLEPVLGFGQDLKHAEQMAEDYAGYFSKDTGDLGNRLLLILGKNRGKISAKELEAALRQYREGKIDGIVALVSGMTEGQKDPVLQAVERGEIEAVFTVDALVEGADLYMFSHQIGARPTFSRYKKGQERGRINRRGPDEVDEQGRLLKDPPKILFDVVDRYRGELPLIRYGDILGVGGHAQLKNGEMLDALSGEEVQEVDRRGAKLLRHRPASPKPPKPGPRPRDIDSDWRPLIAQLEKVLAEQYQGDLESLALDLGESEGFVTELLEGRAWEHNRWFLKRLGTLLYQGRQDFVRVYREPYLAAFRQALSQIEAEGKEVGYMAVADLAWRLYGEGFPEGKRLSQQTFRNMVSGSGADPEVLRLLASSDLVSKQNSVLDRSHVILSFQRALSQIDAEGKEVGYMAVADLACRLYGEGFPEDERPSQHTFRHMVSGSSADPEVLRLLASSDLVSKRSHSVLDRSHVILSFQEAMRRIEAEGKEVGYTAVADLAWRLYGEGLPEGERPSQHTFRHIVSGPRADPEVLRLLASSALVSKQSQAVLDRSKVISSFRQALSQIEAEGNEASYQAVAALAWCLYGEGLPESERLSQGTFRNLVSGSSADPELLSLLASSALVSKQSHTVLERSRLISSFERALSQIEAGGKEASYRSVADLAWRLYGEGLPEGERPSQSTFRQLVSGSSADPEVLRLLASSALVSKRSRVFLDRSQVISSFQKALIQIEAEGKEAGYMAVADLAWRLYGEGLPEGERPRQGTFRQLVSGSKADPELINLLLNSPWIKKKGR